MECQFFRRHAEYAPVPGLWHHPFKGSVQNVVDASGYADLIQYAESGWPRPVRHWASSSRPLRAAETDSSFPPASAGWLNTIFERSNKHHIAFVAIAFFSILSRRLKRLLAEELNA
jgi:hypothetical protein